MSNDGKRLEPHAVGWVLINDGGENGIRSQRVRIPLSRLARFATGEQTPPDLRANKAAQIGFDLMSDATLAELAREGELARKAR